MSSNCVFVLLSEEGWFLYQVFLVGIDFSTMPLEFRQDGILGLTHILFATYIVLQYTRLELLYVFFFSVEFLACGMAGLFLDQFDDEGSQDPVRAFVFN